LPPLPVVSLGPGSGGPAAARPGLRPRFCGRPFFGGQRAVCRDNLSLSGRGL
jgi:hypothetical protein